MMDVSFSRLCIFIVDANHQDLLYLQPPPAPLPITLLMTIYVISHIVEFLAAVGNCK